MKTRLNDGRQCRATNLPVSPDNRTEKLPRATASIQSYHAQDLEEPESAKRGCRYRLTGAADTQQYHTDGDHDDI